jgi:1-acyl-sn-glycerol-3-phosphate acyltransferase
LNNVEPQVVSLAQRRNSLFSRLRSYFFFVPVVYLYTGVLGTLALLASLFDGTGRVQHWFARTWSQLILKTIGIRVHVQGMENVHPSQAAVYAVNHLSAADIPVLYGHLPVQFRILAKKELFRYPFLGWYLKRSGQIPIVYGDPHASLRSLNRAGDALRKGVPLVIFPEGGRSATGRLQNFMNGAFYVAIRAQAPVVPVAIVGTYELLPINSFHVMPGDVVLAIGEPIPTVGMRLRDMEKLSSQVRQAITDLYDSQMKSLAPISANNEPKTKVMLTPES